MSSFTLRIVSEKDAATPEEAILILLDQIEQGEIEVEIFKGENYEHSDVADEIIYASDLKKGGQVS